MIEVKREAAGLRVSLFDNGRGFEAEKLRAEPQARRGLGLASIEERAKYLGGSLDLQSAPGRGARLTLRVPLQLTTDFTDMKLAGDGSGWNQKRTHRRRQHFIWFALHAASYPCYP